MATELSVETNAKKIQTLTKVAKLLRDQIQEQNKKIDSLQVEIIRIKEQLERISGVDVSPITTIKEGISPIMTSSTQDQSFQKEQHLPGIEKSLVISHSDKTPDDKEQLLNALKVIDEL